MRLSKKQKEILKWGMENLKGKSIYCPILDCKVYFLKIGIKHAIYYNSSFEKIKIFQNIASYLKRANERFIEFDKNDPQKKVFKLSLYANIEGEKYHIYIIVKENGKGKYYYDSGIIKKFKRTKGDVKQP